MDTSKVTVLIISNDDNSTKSFEIKSSHIKNFQKYIIAVSAIAIFIFMGLVSLFGYIFHMHSENSDLNSQLVDANKQIETVTENKVKEKLNNIDLKMSIINNYLLERGALDQGNVGGDVSAKENIYSKLNYFEKQSVVFLTKLENMPVGYPFNGPVSSGYGYRTNPFGGRSGEFHPGIDFKGQIGDPIYATGSGIVSRCDWYNGYGNAVIIDHGQGLQTLFGHMSKVNVSLGQKITAGDLLGFVGTTGRSTGPHVHYEIRKDGDNIPGSVFKIKILKGGNMFGGKEKSNSTESTPVSNRPASTSSSSKEIRTLIGEGCKVEGNFFIPNATRIDGIIKGDLTGDSAVVIGNNGRIEGNISASEAVIYGTVTGNIDTQRLELKKGCHVDGDITVVNLVTEQGCTFNGRCAMKSVESSNVTELKVGEGV